MAEAVKKQQKKTVSLTCTSATLISELQLTASLQFRSFIWDSDTHLKTPEERKLLRKIDLSILVIGCFGFFVRLP